MKINRENQQFRLRAGAGLRGTVAVPGDKSISHRAVMLGGIADGVSQVRGWLAAGDTEATLAAMQSLGVRVERADAGTLKIYGGPLRAAAQPLNLMNAGTGIRLLAGIMAGQPFASVLDGSRQLRQRPMKRITQPLQQMGARIEAQAGRCPLRIKPARLHGIEYAMPVASGQVKSAVLLAGLYAEGTTTVLQPGPARDHTERILQAMGAPVEGIESSRVSIAPADRLKPLDITVPGDFSSAAFLLVAGLLVADSDLTLRGINLNPTRIGLLDVLIEMGAQIEVQERGLEAGEPIADLRVRTSELRGIEIGGEVVVRMIDEFPILMVAALNAGGTTTVRDAQELRVKETDRIAVMAQELGRMGAQIDERADGFRIVGRQHLKGAVVDGHDDHRIAMSMTIAGLTAQGETLVQDAACAGDSFPGFAETLRAVGAELALEGVE